MNESCRYYFALFIAFALFGAPFTSSADDNFISVKSSHSVAATADRFAKLIEEKNLSLFTRIDHADNAGKVALTLRPTQLILFGNPKAGTPLMNCAQSVAIDLPQKALFWEDENGDVWLSYNNPAYLKQRHNIQGCDAVLEKISGLLKTLARLATGTTEK